MAEAGALIEADALIWARSPAPAQGSAYAARRLSGNFYEAVTPLLYPYSPNLQE